MYYIVLLLTVAKKRVCAPVAHKYFLLHWELLIASQMFLSVTTGPSVEKFYGWLESNGVQMAG